jgi:hypothetical protein
MSCNNGLIYIYIYIYIVLLIIISIFRFKIKIKHERIKYENIKNEINIKSNEN